MNQPVVGKSKEQKDNEEYSKNFARIPNMLFTSFKYLSKEEKFLYCTLKCIYWDARPRFVSLRELGDVTGYSRGALANMLPRLHTCGLIHAEIRRERNSKGIEYGNPKYHITILDIWELNKLYHSCPPNGRDALDPSLELVHQKSQDRPQNGQGRPSDVPSLSTKSAEAGISNGQVHARSERAKDKDLLKTPSKKEERETPAAPTSPAPTQSSLSPSSVQNNSHQKKQAQIVHPLHSFLLLDDAIAPTTLTILLTSGRYESELEDDRRMRIAEEVQWDLEARGHIVQGVCVREQEQTVIEVPPTSLFERLTDAQADFWRRWCALSHCSDDALTEKLLPDIAWLAERVANTANLESLYRSNAAMLLELSQAKGTQYTPPHLKNLIKHYPTWKATQDAKQKQREQASKKAVPGTGSIQNWTMARLSGKMDAPPVVYPDTEPKKKLANATESMGIKKDLAAMFERMRS